MPEPVNWIVEAAIADRRSQASWNDRLTHWERPASEHEEAKIQSAARVASELVLSNERLTEIGVRILPQGSYHNNTNVRLEADMDLRVQIPTLMVRYESGIESKSADTALGYILKSGTLGEEADEVRSILVKECSAKFGHRNVTLGNKAVTVDGLSGSRADVDLVPAFHLRYVFVNSSGVYDTINGVGIKAADGSETWNFPDQHYANGVEKRNLTSHRFKRIVRCLKRLNYELAEMGAISRCVPSFLVECLVYLVENQHFTDEDDDRFLRFARVINRITELLDQQSESNRAFEINGVKYLFHEDQAWTLNDAKNFATAALVRVMA